MNPYFDEARDFSQGRALVRLNGRYGFIDASGSVVIEPEGDDAKSFSNGLALVREDDRFGYIDREGELLHRFPGMLSHLHAAVRHHPEE